MAIQLMPVIPDTITELLRQRAETSRLRPATWRMTTGRRWAPTTFAELWGEAKAFANGLSEIGVQEGDRVAILAPTSHRWQIAELGAMSVRGVIVGIDAHAAPEQIAYILAHSNARRLVVDSAQRLEQLPQDAIVRLETIILMEGCGEVENARKYMAWGEVLRKGSVADPLRKMPEPCDAATLLYTSGTTGAPKGILYDHAQLMVACRSIAEAFPEVAPGDRTLCWLPMAPLFQRMMNLVALACDAETYFVNDPGDVVAVAGEVEPAVLIGVPRFFEKLHDGIQERVAGLPGRKQGLVNAALSVARKHGSSMRSGSRANWSLAARRRIADLTVLRHIRRALGSKLKFMITGSAPSPIWLLEFFHDLGLPLLEAYGLSENTVPMAVNRPSAFRLGSVGKVLTANDVKLDDAGQILVRGPGVFKGYMNETSSNLFTDDGFYRTGDFGSLDSDGYLHLLGRGSEIIKTSTGRKVSAVRVQSTYAQSRYFDQVIVLGEGRKHLVGLIAIRPGVVREYLVQMGPLETVGEEDLARHPATQELVAQELDRYGAELAPYERIVRHAILPRPLSISHGELTSTLKIRRGEVASRYASLVESLYEASGFILPPSPARETREFSVS